MKSSPNSETRSKTNIHFVLEINKKKIEQFNFSNNMCNAFLIKCIMTMIALMSAIKAQNSFQIAFKNFFKVLKANRWNIFESFLKANRWKFFESKSLAKFWKLAGEFFSSDFLSKFWKLIAG